MSKQNAYGKELAICLLQCLWLYVLPLMAKEGSLEKLQIALVTGTVFCAVQMGMWSHCKMKFLYPCLVICAISIYNREIITESATWHLSLSIVGVAIGSWLQAMIEAQEMHGAKE